MSRFDPSLGGHHSQRTGSEPGLSIEAMLPRLFDALDAHDWPTRERAFEALARTRDPRALPVLLEKLRSENRHIRAAAAEALGRLGHEGGVADLIEVMEEDESPFVRATAAQALGRIGHPDSTVPLRLAFRHDDHGLVSEAAYEALQMVRSQKGKFG